MDSSFYRMVLLASSLASVATCTPQGKKVPATTEISTQTQNDRMVQLRRSFEWKAFKSFWRYLDAVEPPSKKSREGQLFGGQYAHSLSYIEADSLKKTLDTLESSLYELSGSGDSFVLDSIEIAVLNNLAKQRIEYMQNGQPSMYTRMMIMPGSIMLNRESSFVQLENQIDTLINLRKRNSVSDKEFNAALNNIQESLKSFAVLDILYRQWPYDSFGSTSFSDTVINSAESHIERFEKQYSDFKNRHNDPDPEKQKIYSDLQKKYEETTEELKKLKPLLPRLSELIEDLER